MQSVNRKEITAAIIRLRRFHGMLSSQQYKTIKGQIIAGDICEAEKGLRKMLPANCFKEGYAHELLGKHQ